MREGVWEEPQQQDMRQNWVHGQRTPSSKEQRFLKFGRKGATVATKPRLVLQRAIPVIGRVQKVLGTTLWRAAAASRGLARG
jgi:hypothetical protein